MKVLIIRFSSIGDIVFTTPAIRCIKQQVPNAEVHFLTKQSFKAVTEHNPYIDKFFYFDGDLNSTIDALKKEGYDYVVDLHKNFRTFRIKQALKAKNLTYKKLTFQKFVLTKLHINIMSKRHIVDRCMDAIAPLGVINDGKGLDYFIPEKDVVPVTDLPHAHLFGFIAIVIGASYPTKKLPVYKMQELCNSIQHPIILIGGKEDVEEGNAIAAIDPIKIYNACGKFNLHQSADLIRRSKLVISHDTGMQYIACAFNKKVLAIWGGTSPKLQVEPYYGKQFTQKQSRPPYENFIVPGLSCQPCSNYGKNKCPRGHFKCMKNQDTQLIAQTAMNWL